jgi:hypothetical protein
MVDRRVKEIVARAERARREREARAAEKLERERSEQEFLLAWLGVYPSEGVLDDVVANEILTRYTGIVPGICDRLWDFPLAEWALRPNLRPQFEIAIRVLGYVCQGRQSEARDCLLESRSLIGDVKRAHNKLHEEFSDAISGHGLPFTPLFNSTEMHELLGVTYEAFRWARDQGWWKTHPDDQPGKHKHRWRHNDPNVQRLALETIRKDFPKKIWGAFR